jgi:EAL domain-containing protein (putative c-di-GMP-specific phosphodiesterase class I)
LRDDVQRRRVLSRDLLTAVDDGSLELVYQVQQSVRTGETVGFEALLRWTHRIHGPISPVEFIPIAEENGAIIPIGAWVARRACRDAMGWPAHVKVAVNLSPAQFRDDLDATLIACLDASGLPASRLEVEITESLLIENPAYVQTLLRRIKALGVSIAMDDFGTGFSSLSTLQAFPFDKIKIDRSFVEKLTTNPQAAAIVRAVVNLGKSLDIPVLAEGVERQAHLDFLKEQGCASAQGYLLGRPTSLIGTRLYFEACAAIEGAAISSAA